MCGTGYGVWGTDAGVRGWVRETGTGGGGILCNRGDGGWVGRYTDKTPKNWDARIIPTPHPNFFFRFYFSAALRLAGGNPNSIYN